MEAALGWTLLSRDALKRAETQLRGDVEGVRDEVGFLLLHQAYADRFFPGTSVLHTRLRYALFVPWTYLELAKESGRGRLSDRLRDSEIETAKRLKGAGQEGVIGGRSLPAATSQPPTMVYWSALAAWGILRRWRDGTYPSRAQVHRMLGHPPKSHSLHDDDDQLLLEGEPLFCSLPDPPPEWRHASLPLTFTLRPEDRAFLRRQLLAVRRERDGELSLLSRLVEANVQLRSDTSLWSPRVRQLAADEDQGALVRARKAAALAAIGRALYAAMVEQIRDQEDGVDTANVHRRWVDRVVVEHGHLAGQLALDELEKDVPRLDPKLLHVLQSIQRWLPTGGDFLPLREVFAIAELARKGNRARLTNNLRGKDRRREWMPDDLPPAEPLHYRWKHVRRLLMDLEGGDES